MTTLSHCLYHPVTRYIATGTKTEIVEALYDMWELRGKDRQLVAKPKGKRMVLYHSYSPCWTYDDARSDAIGFLFQKLVSQEGYTHYREIA